MRKVHNAAPVFYVRKIRNILRERNGRTTAMAAILRIASRQLEKHSREVHNSRRPLDRSTLTLTLTLTFDL